MSLVQLRTRSNRKGFTCSKAVSSSIQNSSYILSVQNLIMFQQIKRQYEVPYQHRSTPQANSVKLSTIRIWMHDKDVAKLGQVLLAGHGNLLRQQASTNPKMKRFLAAIPYVMNDIRELHQAVINNDQEILLNFMELKVCNFLIGSRDLNGLTILHKAAGLGHTKVLEMLLKKWPSGISVLDLSGRTPLHWAASAKNKKCYSILIENGCDQNIRDAKMKLASYYLKNPTELERAFLSYVPWAPRKPSNIPTDYSVFFEENSEVMITDGGKSSELEPEEDAYIEQQKLSNEITNGTEINGDLHSVHDESDTEIFQADEDILSDSHSETSEEYKVDDFNTDVVQKELNDQQYNDNIEEPELVSLKNGMDFISKDVNNIIVEDESDDYLDALSEPLIKALIFVNNVRPTEPLVLLANCLQNSFKNMQDETEYPSEEVQPNSTMSMKNIYENDDRDEHGQSMLHFACARSLRRGTLLNLLIQSKTDITYRDELYRTARDVALQANHPNNAKEIDQYVMSLASLGAIKPFEHFAMQGYDHILDITDNDKTIIDVVQHNGHTELEAFLNKLKLMEELREKLHEMIRLNDTRQVEELLGNSFASWLLQSKNYYGRTAVHIAVLKESEAMLNIFVQIAPESLHISDNLGRTTLHYAMGTNNVENLSRTLIRSGVSRTAKDLKGRQAAYYFLNKSEIARLQEEEDENR